MNSLIPIIALLETVSCLVKSDAKFAAAYSGAGRVEEDVGVKTLN
jgi:hypothetical protein